MACTLSVCTTGADFQASTGASFSITVVGTKTPAVVLCAVYNSTTLTKAPWTFTVAKGFQVLTVVVESSSPGDRMSLQEVCSGGSSQELDSFYYNPSSSPDGLEIMGL
jgi:hypothetical protein